MEVKCSIYEKIRSGEELTEDDKKNLKEIIRRMFNFFVEQEILPTPNNYAKWFFVFCYVVENRIEPTVNELIDIYYKIFKEAKIDLRVSGEIERILNEVKHVIYDYLDTVQGYDRKLGKHEKKLEEVSAQKEQMEILREILQELTELRKTNQELIEKLKEKQQYVEKLKKELETLKKQAFVDYLTGLKNRRSIEKALYDYFNDFQRYKYPFSVIMFDVNNFKEINDKYGHPVGDCVLRHIGDILRKYLRAKDAIGRYGGDEFLIILPGVNLQNAVKIARRLKNAIENYFFDCGDKELKVSASFGVVEVNDRFRSVEEILREVDKKLYEAKSKDEHIAY
ncbi:MAG: diguanylate cyclase [Aquificae bacterium]|nr:diguanylate cyclase [Aquificota bacterium]